jgi:hypothetical protein
MAPQNSLKFNASRNSIRSKLTHVSNLVLTRLSKDFLKASKAVIGLIAKTFALDMHVRMLYRGQALFLVDRIGVLKICFEMTEVACLGQI